MMTPGQITEAVRRVAADESLTAVGRTYGVSRERIRQLVARHGGKPRREIMREQAVVRKKQRREGRGLRRGDFGVYGFRLIGRIRAWLCECGYGYCGIRDHIGGRVIALSEMNGAEDNRCKACHRAWRQSPTGRAKVNAYHRRYRQRRRAALDTQNISGA